MWNHCSGVPEGRDPWILTHTIWGRISCADITGFIFLNNPSIVEAVTILTKYASHVNCVDACPITCSVNKIVNTIYFPELFPQRCYIFSVNMYVCILCIQSFYQAALWSCVCSKRVCVPMTTPQPHWKKMCASACSIDNSSTASLCTSTVPECLVEQQTSTVV